MLHAIDLSRNGKQFCNIRLSKSVGSPILVVHFNESGWRRVIALDNGMNTIRIKRFKITVNVTEKYADLHVCSKLAKFAK